MITTGYRLFVAVELSPGIRAALAGLQRPLAGAAWVRAEALHLTLRFLGTGIPARQLERVQAALGVVALPPFTLEVAGVGRFPPHGPARVIWAGVRAPPGLPALAQAVEQAAEAAGFTPETRPFSPHITLARLKGQPAPQPVAECLAALRDFRAGSMPVQAFALMSSTPGPHGSTYTALGAWPLDPPPEQGPTCD